MNRVVDFFKENKWSLVYILFLVVVVFFPFIFNLTSLNYRFQNMDITNFHIPNNYLIKESLLEYGQYPLWNEIRLTEPVLAAEPQLGFPSIETPINFIASTGYAGFRLNMIFMFFLGALGMYLLALKLKLDKKIALLVVTVYMINSNSALGFYGYNFFAVSYIALPFVLLFTIYAIERKEYWFYATLAGIAFAISFLGGEVSFFLYTIMFFALFLLYRFAISPKKSTLVKLVFIFLIVMIITAGLISIKLFISRDWISKTNRSPEQGLEFSYDTFLGPYHSYLHRGTFVKFLIRDEPRFPFNRSGGNAGVGVIAFSLLFFSIPKFRSKRYLFFQLALVFFILLMMRSPISYFFWKFVPVFKLQRNMYKALFVYNLCAAVLAGVGLTWILNKFGKFKYIGIVPVLLIGLILLEMGFLGLVGEIFSGKLITEPDSTKWLENTFDVREVQASNKILQYIASQNGKFRFKDHTENQPHGKQIDFFTVPLGLQNIWGRNNLWNTEYVIYPMIAESSEKKARLYGILNVRYLISPEEINISGFDFVRKFDISGTNIKIETERSSFGPYLYENKEYMPRAYMVSKALLVVGEGGYGVLTDGKKAMYSLLMEEDFNPRSSVIVYNSEKISKINSEVLSSFGAIVLIRKGFSDDEVVALRNYKLGGGILIPDIFNDQEVNNSKIYEIFGGEEDYEEIEYILDTPNRDILDVSGREGFLVLSEVYSLYPGWKAKIDGKNTKIMRANGVISSVYVPMGSEELELVYRPRLFIIGRNITVLTLVLIIVIFILFFIKKK